MHPPPPGPVRLPCGSVPGGRLWQNSQLGTGAAPTAENHAPVAVGAQAVSQGCGAGSLLLRPGPLGVGYWSRKHVLEIFPFCRDLVGCSKFFCSHWSEHILLAVQDSNRPSHRNTTSKSSCPRFLTVFPNWPQYSSGVRPAQRICCPACRGCRTGGRGCGTGRRARSPGRRGCSVGLRSGALALDLRHRACSTRVRTCVHPTAIAARLNCR